MAKSHYANANGFTSLRSEIVILENSFAV